MPNEKEFGKVTADQLMTLLGFMPILEELQANIQGIFKESPNRVAEFAPKGFCWASTYEIPINHHIALIAIMAGKAHSIMEMARSPDPAAALIADFQNLEDSDPGLDYSYFGEKHSFTFFAGLVLALIRSFESVAVYGHYIHEFIAKAKSASPDRDRALFCAIRMDTSVITGPTAARRISTALAMGDEQFLVGLRLAMEGKTGDQAAYLRKFRYAIKVLVESSALQGSATALAKRLVELGIYPDGFTAEKNAAELVRKAQINHSI